MKKKKNKKKFIFYLTYSVLYNTLKVQSNQNKNGVQK